MPQKLGQHFLINPEIARTIVTALENQIDDHILEIGPGKGFLTEYLLDFNSAITAVEIDTALFEGLSSKYIRNNLQFVNGDFLKTDLKN